MRKTEPYVYCKSVEDDPGQNVKILTRTFSIGRFAEWVDLDLRCIDFDEKIVKPLDLVRGYSDQLVFELQVGGHRKRLLIRDTMHDVDELLDANPKKSSELFAEHTGNMLKIVLSVRNERAVFIFADISDMPITAFMPPDQSKCRLP